MIVWITHVKVGHRQTSIPKSPQVNNLGAFYFLILFNTGKPSALVSLRRVSARADSVCPAAADE